MKTVLISCFLAGTFLIGINSANAWTQTPIAIYNHPSQPDGPYSMTLGLYSTYEGFFEPLPYIGEPLIADVEHNSSHAIICEGAFWDAFAGNCSASYAFSNEAVTYPPGTDVFSMGLTARHVVLAGYGVPLIETIRYSAARPEFSYSIPKESTAVTSGSFSMANGVSTGLGTCSKSDVVYWSLLVPGIVGI
jgi:hypothetical protein